MSDSIGKRFRVTNWGESHGTAIGAVIEGCPPNFRIDIEDIQKELDRRRPGQSNIASKRNEPDRAEILSGIFNGKTTGAAISIIIRNKDQRKEEYDELKETFRPGHADFTYEKKYRIRDHFGGGRSSARLTASNVAAGAIAKKILKTQGIEIAAYVKKIRDIEAEKKDTPAENIVRCPDSAAAEKMIRLIKEVEKQGDSVGGVVECIIKNLPAGLGEPMFDKLDADLAKAMMCINATKGFEIGSGFRCCEMLGSEHNDEFTIKDGKVATKTNNSGGVLGGISNSMPVVFRVAFKPTPSIKKIQKTVDSKGHETELKIEGRHDPCVVPRAVPVVEAMAAIVILDHLLRAGDNLERN